MARRLVIESAIQEEDVQQAVCSALRTRHKLLAVPRPRVSNELLLISDLLFQPVIVNVAQFQAKVSDCGETQVLRFDCEPDTKVIAELLEKAMVREFEQDSAYWRVNTSARFWYASQAANAVDGIEAIRRLSFAVTPLPDCNLGIALDVGYLFRSAWNIADFFDGSVGSSEQESRRKRFNRLRSRDAGRKGTLLYDTGSLQVMTCYFERFATGATCGTVPGIEGAKSLFEYCHRKYPDRAIRPEDPVAFVRFKGIRQAVPVPAKWLRLRISLSREQMPRSMRQAIAMSPTQRRSAAIANWEPFGPRAVAALGLRDERKLWTPSTGNRERLVCPKLLFGQGREVSPPSQPTREEYQRYFRERSAKLRNGGAFRFEPNADRTIHVVTPHWDDAIERQFTRDLQASLSDVTGLNFRLQSIRADTPEETVERLRQCTRGTAVIVFDPTTTDQAAYSLLSYELKHWTIKRLLRRTVESRWAEMQRANGDPRVQRNWKNAIDLSALDVLDLMGTTLWRLDEFGYDACFAIDVGQDRRHYAISMLICRDIAQDTSFMRVSRWWHKADHQHEGINAEILAKSFADVSVICQNRAISPLKSILVLRDGHQIGNEIAGIRKGLEHWTKAGLLQQGGLVDVVDVQKHSQRGVRLWNPCGEGAQNVLEGQAIYPNKNTAIVCSTGAASLSADMTADPCVLICQDGTNIRQATRAFYALAQLNYSTPSKAHRLAQPLREVDAILEDCQMRNMRGIR